jgi:flagellar basal-body rod modification protein FlgD
LLITELQNQNPLDPVDNQQMAAQLAQFSQLQLTEDMNGNIEVMNSTMEDMNTTFQGAMLVAELDYARSLLGKEVSFYSGDYGQTVSGKVEKVSIVNGEPMLEVNSKVTLDDGSESEEITFSVSPSDLSGIKE